MGGKSQGVSPEVSQGELNNQNQLVAIAQQQNQRGTQLFNESFPGFQKAEDFYSTLSTGDPYAISRAIAPAAQQITAGADAAKANILRTGAPGGEKNLALEQVDVQRGAQVGSTAASGYLNSFNALAQLAGQGVNQSIASAGTGISGYQAGTQALGQLGNQQLEAQQMQAQEKGSTFGSLAGLGGSVAGAAGEAGSFATLFAGI